MHPRAWWRCTYGPRYFGNVARMSYLERTFRFTLQSYLVEGLLYISFPEVLYPEPPLRLVEIPIWPNNPLTCVTK